MDFYAPYLIIRFSKVIKQIQFAKHIFNINPLQSFAGWKRC